IVSRHSYGLRHWAGRLTRPGPSPACPVNVMPDSRADAKMRDLHESVRVVAMCLGLRISEIVGLQWGDFDWDKLQVMVQRSVVLGKAGECKTKYSRKRIPLDPALAHVLFSLKERTAPDAQDSDRVFANPDTGKPWWPGRIQQKRLAPAGVKAGVGPI